MVVKDKKIVGFNVLVFTVHSMFSAVCVLILLSSLKWSCPAFTAHALHWSSHHILEYRCEPPTSALQTRYVTISKFLCVCEKKKLKKQIQYTGKRRLMSEYKQIQKKGLAPGIWRHFSGRLNIWQVYSDRTRLCGWVERSFSGMLIFLFVVLNLSLSTKLFRRIAKTASTSTTNIYAESSSHRSIRTSLPFSSFRPRCFIRIYTKMEKYV